MIVLAYIVVGLYMLALLVIFLYSSSQFMLMLSYVRRKNKQEVARIEPAFKVYPAVTIQLPVYNEQYVIERLLQCITSLDYDRDKLQIQVLDDSTDSSLQQTVQLVKILQARGFDISCIHRESREGYKAGALKHGLEKAKGEFIGIFDADFLPPADWIKKTLQGFENDEIGMVQTRWGHLNKNYSLLTRMQAFALDIHFVLEQTGRNRAGHFINFNGTAGLWRKTCIIEAGNWSGDTLTEDLDLSYRAQMLGWKFKYLENVVAPAELPIVISAARSQQFRWNKGGAENLVRLIPKLFRNEKIPFATKWHALFHLGNSSIFFFVLLVSVLSVPMIYIKHFLPGWQSVFEFNAFFMISTVMLFICHWVVYKKIYGSGFIHFVQYIKTFVTFFTLALGFSYHNTAAVAEAFAGRRSAFIRTPKFNVLHHSDSWKQNKYLNTSLNTGIVVEIALFFYFLYGMFISFYLKDYAMLPFHLMLCLGFGYVIAASLRDRV